MRRKCASSGRCARLRPGGKLLIGDVAFADRAQLLSCAQHSGDAWDDEEFYFVYDEIAPHFADSVRFTPFSSCAGVLTFEKIG